jgi:hypothetical protein
MRRVPQHDSAHVTGQIDYGHDAQARVECRQLRAAVVGGRRATAPAARARFVPDAARPTEHSEQPRRHRRHPTTTTPTSHRRSGQEPLLPAGGSRIREPWKELADRFTVRGQHRRTTSLWPTSIATSTATNDLDILGHEPKMRPVPGQIPGSHGRCVRLRISSIAADHHALRVLLMANTSGPSKANHGQSKPLLKGSVPLESCYSQALDQPHVPPAGLGPGMGPGPGAKVVGHQGAGIPSRRRRRRSRSGVGGPDIPRL